MKAVNRVDIRNNEDLDDWGRLWKFSKNGQVKEEDMGRFKEEKYV